MLSDLSFYKTKSNEIGLQINDNICGVTLLHHASEESAETFRAFKDILPLLTVVSREVCSLLGI